MKFLELIVEVAESLVAYHRVVKIPRYADAGVLEVVLLDLAAGEIRIHRNPIGGAYEDEQNVSSGSLPAPEELPGVQLAFQDV